MKYAGIKLNTTRWKINLNIYTVCDIHTYMFHNIFNSRELRTVIYRDNSDNGREAIYCIIADL